MENAARTSSKALVMALLVVGLIALAGVTMVRTGMSWGTISIRPSSTVTVSGFAKEQQMNQMARYSAGVSATDANKEVAVEKVNTEVAKLIVALETFGIEKKDIQTQNLSVYKMEKPIFETRQAGTQDEAWSANNTVEVTLREVERASALADLLTSSGATNVYGPMFGLSDEGMPEDALMGAAIENAREKAQTIANSSGRRLGKIINVVEGGDTGGIYPMMDRAASALGGGGGAPVESGTTQISKSVSVTFELR